MRRHRSLAPFAHADTLQGVAAYDTPRRVRPRGDHLQVPREASHGSAREGDAEGVTAASFGGAEESSGCSVARTVFPEGDVRGSHSVDPQLEVPERGRVVVLVHREHGDGRVAARHAHEHAPGPFLQTAQLDPAPGRIRRRGFELEAQGRAGEVVPWHPAPPLPLRLRGEHA